MRFRLLAFLLLPVAFFSACDKNNVSKIPHITLIAFVPDSMKVNIDTTYIEFSLIDGDADIGNDPVSMIHIKDSRVDTFQKVPFPNIDATIEDPKKGLEGKCILFPFPQPTPRLDSVHLLNGDTLTYEFYITDRANHESNHITTHQLIIRP